MFTALITGASRGLGYELCKQLTNSGWKVAALSRTKSKDLEELIKNSNGHLMWFECDVTQKNAQIATSKAVEFLGSLHLLINNAGISGWSVGLVSTESKEVQTLLDTHTFGCLRITRAAIPALLATKNSHIINISSRLGSISKTANGDFIGKSFSYSYRIAKASLNMLSACIAEEFSPYGIRVSVLHPGLILSGTASTDAEMSAQDAAERIFRWLPTRDKSAIVYLEPEKRFLPW